MRNKKMTRHGITLLLLLTFFQQIGGGLFIHNLVHDTTETEQVPFRGEGKKEVNFACSCVDDFLMPFVSGDGLPDLQIPVFYTRLADTYVEQHYFTSLYFSSLRGPPALIG